MYSLVLILAPIWLTQTVLAAACLKRHCGTRIPAVVLMIVAPLPLVAALFAEAFFRANHVPSSFDALGDGFEIFVKCVSLVVGTVLLSGAACVWLSFQVCTPHRRPA